MDRGDEKRFFMENLKLVNIDDYNKYYNNVELTIIYSKGKNKLVEQGNALLAEGLYYCPFSYDLVKEREKRINNKSLDKFNGVVEFWFV